MPKRLEEIIEKHEKWNKTLARNIVLLSLFIILFSSLLLVIKPQITGFVVLETGSDGITTITWDFSDSSDYYYDSSLIDLNENEVKLKTTTTQYIFTHSDFENGTLSNINIIDDGISPKKNTTPYYVTQALYDPKNKTSQLNSIGDGDLIVEDGEILNIEFENSLDNQDVVSLYITDGNLTYIYLCDLNISCTSPGYGLVYYDKQIGWYNITITGLSNQKKIFKLELADEVEFDYITSNKGDILRALYDPKNKTSKVNSIGNGHQNVKKDKIFDVFFDGGLGNGDIISLYIENSDLSDIYLCDVSTECSSPGHGLVSYDGEEGWYNITITGLSSPQNSFNIDPAKVKIDYIEAIHYLSTEGTFTSPVYDTGLDVEWSEISWEENIASGTDITLQIRTSSDNIDWGEWSSDYVSPGEQITSDSGRYIQFKATLNGELDVPILSSVTISYTYTDYISSGVIETKDITPDGLTNWNSFMTTQSLNNQNIDYYYSLDSGNNWEDVTSGSNLSSLDVSTEKIRFKAVLSSDGTSTPAIEKMDLIYDACQENWEITYGDCLTDDTKLKTYIDTNNCGTTNNLPEDDGTYVGCNYCTSTWENINISCQLDDIFVIGYSYTNNCCEETGLTTDCNIPENTTAVCDYCTSNWTCTGYNVCQPNDKIPCLNVTDNIPCYEQTNLDSDLYSGNYSEFEQICVYDRTAPLLNDVSITPKKTSTGDLINITVNVTDISDISYVKSIIKNSEGVQIKEINLDSTGDLFTAILNTTNMSKGTYIVDIDTEDVLSNNVYYSFKGILALDHSAEDTLFVNKDLNENTKSVIEDSDIVLEIIPNKSILNVSIGIAKYTDNIVDLTPAGVKDTNKFIEILLDDNFKSSIKNITIKIPYNDSEIQNLNINEGTLKIYNYNEETSSWDVLNSIVNTTGNYVKVIVNHFSLYALFGEETEGEVVQSSGSGGGGSGGGGKFITSIKKDLAKEETEKKKENTYEETKKEEVCKYTYSVYIPEKISFLDADIVKGQIKNDGTCLLDKVELQLSQDISKYIVMGNNVFENLGRDESVEFQLVLKDKEIVSKKKLRAQGFVVKSLRNTIKSYNGEIITKVVSQNNVLKEEKTPFEIYILKPADFKTFMGDKGIFLISNTISMLITIFVVIVLIIKNRNKKMNSNNKITKILSKEFK